MSYDIQLHKLDETYYFIRAEQYILKEIQDYFTFYAPNYRNSPKFKAKIWTGKISLVNAALKTIYVGLLNQLRTFAEERQYTIQVQEDKGEDISYEQLREFLKDLELPDWIEIRDYQIKAFVKCIKKKRALLLSPTASGKSFMIYLIFRWLGLKTLIVVPSTALVYQMLDDFRSYGYTGNANLIADGAKKHNDEELVISTWEAIYKLDPDWYKDFGLVIGDEAHQYKAKSLIKIITSMPNTSWRFGTTGTLDNEPLNELTIQGLFGPIVKTTSTVKLMDKGYVSQLTIEAIVLEYEEKIREELAGSFKNYHAEIDYITSLPERHEFIKKLALSLDGNVLILYTRKDHGKDLLAAFRDSGTNRKLHYIDGSVSGEDRNDIKIEVDEDSDSITVASFGTSSTGISIKNINYVIFASPLKSVIRVLQSIGRGLRTSDRKGSVVLFDIADDISWKSFKNYAFKHFKERIKIYDHQKFKHKTTRLCLQRLKSSGSKMEPKL